jgi:hypothetical protein
MAQIETPQRIEPTRLEEISEPTADALASLSTASAKLGSALHPRRDGEGLMDARSQLASSRSQQAGVIR